MLPAENLTTDRLLAERIRAHHFPELYRLHQEPRVMIYFGGLHDEDQTKQFLAKNLDYWDQHGYGFWVFRDQAEGRFVGCGSLKKQAIDGKEEAALAYALLPEFWGRGFATEMARAMLHLGFEQVQMLYIVATVLATNLQSRRVLEKVGFRFERDILHAGLPQLLYSITPSAKPQEPLSP